jgi:phospholipid/cholesterol/gamma-HCH transport system substrate-binding protein
MNRRRSLGALAAAAALLLSACDFSVSKMPLPGGADVGDDPIVVHAIFPDVLDLVPQSTVKLNDVTIGKVTDVSLKNYQADVEMTLRKDVDLPDNVEAEIRQTSLLGEKFVSLRMPESPSEARLGDKDVIGLDRTNRNPEVEEVLGALSLLLNGGGVAQLKTIAHELNLALEGREGNARSVLTQIESFMSQLDENKGDIVHAIDALNRLAVAANKQRGTIEAALDELPSALQSLDKQRADLVKMLGALDRLGNVGTQVIAASKDSTINALRSLNPILGKLGETGDDFIKAFHVFLTYPFVDEVVGRDPQVARKLHMGDYTNLSVQLDINIGGIPPGGGPLGTGLPTFLEPGPILDDVFACLGGNTAACNRVLQRPVALLRLIDECKKPVNKDAIICKQLNLLGGLGGLGGLTPRSTLGETGSALPSLPGQPLSLGRAATAFDKPVSLDKLMGVYDPVLVQLLLPGVAS